MHEGKRREAKRQGRAEEFEEGTEGNQPRCSTATAAYAAYLTLRIAIDLTLLTATLFSFDPVLTDALRPIPLQEPRNGDSLV